MRNLLTIAAVSFALSGCAGGFGPPQYNPPDTAEKDYSKTFAADYSSVWDGAVEWFAINNVPIKNLDKDSGVISSEYSLGSDYTQIDCGSMTSGSLILAEPGEIVANITVLIRERKSGVLVRPQVFGDGGFNLIDPFNGAVVNTVDAKKCISTGEVESQLNEYISDYL